MKSMLLFLLVLGGLAYGALNFHFILLDDTLKVLKKTGPRVENTFVDARGTKVFTLLMKPDLLQAGVEDVLKDTNKSVQVQIK